jgi:O-antigen ligase
VWYGFAAITIGIGVASAGTTGAVFVLAVELMGLFLLAMTRRSKTRKFGPAKTNKVWMAVGAAVIIGTIVTGVAWLATQSLQVIESDVATHVEELSQGQKEFPYSRIGIWKSSWQLIADHPILGTGWGAFSTAYQRYDTGDGSRVVKEAHNDYLQVVCDTGIAGGIVLGVFLGLLLRVIWRSLGSEESPHWPAAAGSAIGCLGILVHSLIDFRLQRPGTALLFLVLIALLISLDRQPCESGKSQRS